MARHELKNAEVALSPVSPIFSTAHARDRETGDEANAEEHIWIGSESIHPCVVMNVN